MDIYEAIEKRHSYRGEFHARPVEHEVLTRIVQAGLLAPSGFNAQTTEFVVVDDPDLMLRLRGVISATPLQSAPVAIVTLMRLEAERDGLYFGIEDYGAAVENILLAATAEGLATVWIDGALRREGRARQIAELLGVPPDREVRVLLPMGYPAAQGAQKEKRPFEQRAWFNRFQG